MDGKTNRKITFIKPTDPKYSNACERINEIKKRASPRHIKLVNL